MSIFHNDHNNSMINESVFIFHKEIMKIYNDPDIIHILSENIYDVVNNPKDMANFKFDDRNQLFEISISGNNSNEEIILKLYTIFANLFKMIICNNRYNYITMNIPEEIRTIIMNSHDNRLMVEFNNIVNSCVTILPLSNNNDNIRSFRINLHN